MLFLGLEVNSIQMSLTLWLSTLVGQRVASSVLFHKKAFIEQSKKNIIKESMMREQFTWQEFDLSLNVSRLTQVQC